MDDRPERRKVEQKRVQKIEKIGFLLARNMHSDLLRENGRTKLAARVLSTLGNNLQRGS